MNAISIYIPSLSVIYNEASVASAFESNHVGQVSRVDFVPIDGDVRFRRAFVHLFNFCNSMIAYDIQNAHAANTAYRWYTADNKSYWLLLKNHRPVAETTLNIHQLAENHRILEETTTKKISALEETVTTQADQIDRLQQTVYQLLSCVNLQSEDIKVFEKVLLNLDVTEDEEDEEDDSTEEEDYADMPGLVPYEPGEKTLEQDLEEDFEMNMNIRTDNDDCWMCDYVKEMGCSGKQCDDCHLKSKGGE